jgi:organic radical activating enzyme
MYCPPALHTSDNDTKSLDDLKKYWLEIFKKTSHLNKPYKINITGGEPTINKNFIPFLEWLRNEYGNYIKTIGVVSNGSASTQYYLKLFSFLDYLSLSTHSEHIQADRFFESAITLSDYARKNNKSFNINIMQEFWADKEIAEYIAQCKQHQISHTFSKIDYEKQNRTIPIFKNKLNDEVGS